VSNKDSEAALKIRTGVVAVLMVLTLAFARDTEACTCGAQPVCNAFYAADAVFTGRAEVTPLGRAEQRTRFVVERSYRGPDMRTIEIVSHGLGGSCDFGFHEGVDYLVFAQRDPVVGWKASLCGGTSPVRKAAEDLRFIKSIGDGSVKGGTFHGSAAIVEPDKKGRLHPTGSLSGVTVTIMNDAHRFTQDTSLFGTFEFRDVPPGKYTVTVRVPPAFSSVAPAEIEIKGPGACALHSFLATRAR
jgi:hypothetical protein